MGMSQFDERSSLVDLYTAGSGNGTDPVLVSGNRDFVTRLDGWYLANLDSIDHQVSFGYYGGSVGWPIGKATLPAIVAGEAPVATDLLALLAGLAASGISIPIGVELYIQCAVAPLIDPAIYSTAVIGAF